MMLWALEDPGRFVRERTALESLAGEATWMMGLKWDFVEDAKLKVDVDLAIGEQTFDVELVYPHLFPDTPAFVRPRTSTARWSSHQYGLGGVLCLEWGPDNWDPEITGAELLRSTYRLLSSERGDNVLPVAVPSRHRLTFGQEVRGSVRRLVLTSAVAEYLNGVAPQTLLRMTTHSVFHESALVIFVSELSPAEGESFRPADLPSGVTDYLPLLSWRGDGWMFKSEALNVTGNIPSAETLLAELHGSGFTNFALPIGEGGKSTKSEYLFLLIGPAEEARALAIDLDGDGTVKEYVVLGPRRGADQRLPSEQRDLSDKKVGIVGLGSVGSKVAMSLARSGVRRFVLVDDDVMLPTNVSRHELDWASVGVGKVDAVKETLSLIASGIEVQVRRSRIAGQESAESASTVLDTLGTCDVLVDATANGSVFVQLAAVARRRKKPLVWGEVFSGGIGALLARSRPGKDPEPLVMRAGVHNYLETLPPAPLAAAVDYDVEIEGAAPLIAFDAEVSQVAATMTRFVLDVLLDRTPPEFPYSAYLIGFKEAWIFDGPFHTQPILVPAQPVAADDSTVDQIADRRKGRDSLAQLINQRTDADSDLTV
jgi:molybdopterin/thiamine biosynthesis adenylyltransferase